MCQSKEEVEQSKMLQPVWRLNGLIVLSSICEPVVTSYVMITSKHNGGVEERFLSRNLKSMKGNSRWKAVLHPGK